MTRPVIHRRIEELAGLPASAVTIGNFDGVHIAHRKLLRRVAQVAADRGLVPTVLTFDPHPTKIVAPERAPRLLSTGPERYALMGSCGIEQVFVVPFNREFSLLSAHDFVKQILVDRANAKAVLVGFNFRFGHRHAGDTTLLKELGEKYGFTVEIVPGLSYRGRVVSSTGVRTAIENGSVALACRMLGRPYAIEGDIVKGHGVGAKQTVPTLNLKTAAELLPAIGVYVTRTTDLDTGHRWNSISNIGYRPTFNGEDLTVETFLLEPLDGDRPDRISLEFLTRVRDERKFSSPEALRMQILKDVARTQRYFARLKHLHERSESEPVGSGQRS